MGTKVTQQDVIIQECPLEDSYKFYGHCAIKTCKYYTLEASNRCVLISGRTHNLFSDTKRVSDLELFKWKASALEIDSLKELKEVRKQACKNVNCILILDKYLRYLEARRPRCKFNRKPNSIEMAYLLLKDLFPFTIEELDFEEWMGVYMFAESVYGKFQQHVYRSSVRSSNTENKAKKPETRRKKTNSTKKESKPKRQILPKAMSVDLATLCFVRKREWEDMLTVVTKCKKEDVARILNRTHTYDELLRGNHEDLQDGENCVNTHGRYIGYLVEDEE